MNEDKIIVCADCKKEFVFSAREQDKIQELFENGVIKEITTAKRCFECRTKRRAGYNEYNAKKLKAE